MGELKQALQQEFNVALRAERDNATIVALVRTECGLIDTSCWHRLRRRIWAQCS